MVVGGLELCRWDPADLSVQTSVVEPIDIREGLVLDIVEPGPRATVDELRLVQAVEGLGEGVVVRVPARAHRGGDTGGLEALGVADSDILNPAVGVMN